MAGAEVKAGSSLLLLFCLSTTSLKSGQFFTSLCVICFVLEPRCCQSQTSTSANTVQISVTFQLYAYNVDLSNTGSPSYKTLQNHVEEGLNKSINIKGWNPVEITTTYTPSQGLFSVNFKQQDTAVAAKGLIKLASSGITVNGTLVVLRVSFQSRNGKFTEVQTQDVCKIRDAIQPCPRGEECQDGVCSDRKQYETTTESLIVLGYAGVFLLALIVMLFVCLCRKALELRKQRSDETTKLEGDAALQNHVT